MKTLYMSFFPIFILILSISAQGLSQNILSSNHYDKGNVDKATPILASIDSLDKLIDLYQKINNLEKMAFALSEKADKLIEVGQVDLAEKMYMQQTQIAEQLKNDTLAYSGIQALRVIYITRGDFKKQHDIGLKGLSLVLKTNDPTDIMGVYTELALDYLTMGQQDSMMFCFKKALSYIKESGPVETRKLYSYLGSYYYKKGDYEGGLPYYLKAIDVGTALKDSASFMPEDLNAVAQAFIKLKNYDKAEQYATRAYQLCVHNNLKFSRINVLYSLGDIKLYKGDTAGVILLYNETIALLKTANDKRSLQRACQQLANIYILKGDLKEALPLLKEATEYNEYLQNFYENDYLQFVWGNYYFKKGATDKAIKILSDALTGATNRGRTAFSLRLYPLLYKAYAQNGQYPLALQTLETYNRINDSINEKSRAEVMLAIESRYELKEKNQTIIGLNAEAQINEARMNASKQLQGVLILGLILTSLLGGLAFYYYRLERQQAAELERQNVIITKAYTDKDLLLREIHHRVKNNLQVVSSLLRLQSRHVHDNQAQEALLEGRNRVNSMALIHQYLYQDEDLTKISADEYIEKLATTLYKSYNVSDKRIKFKANIDAIKLDVDTAIPLGLILNELITNVLKHAFPNKREGILEVSLLRGANDLINLLVRDNGIGFNDTTFKQAKESFGWSLIELFTEKLNGQLTLANGHGTSVNLQFLDKNYFQTITNNQSK